MREKLPVKLIYFSYFLAIFLWLSWRIVETQDYWNWRLWSFPLSWLIGGLVGYYILSLDRLIDVYFTSPQTQLSHYIRYYIAQGKYKAAWATLEKRKKEQLRLAFHSAFFQAIWAVLAIFALTSTVSWLGKGVVIGSGLHLLLSEWRDYLQDPALLSKWLFWQVKREITLKELKAYLWAMTGMMVVFSLMLF